MKEHDNVEIDWGVVEVSVEIVILGDTEAGWTETARKLAEDVEEWTGKIPRRWGRYMKYPRPIIIAHYCSLYKKQNLYTKCIYNYF